MLCYFLQGKKMIRLKPIKSIEELDSSLCPYESWEEGRFQAITDDQKKEWLAAFLFACNTVKRQINNEIKSYAKSREVEMASDWALNESKRQNPNFTPRYS